MMHPIAHDMHSISKADSREAQRRAREQFGSRSSVVQSIMRNERRAVKARKSIMGNKSKPHSHSATQAHGATKRSGKVQPDEDSKLGGNIVQAVEAPATATGAWTPGAQKDGSAV